MALRSLFETLDDVSLVGRPRDVVGNGPVAVGLADDALQLPYSSATRHAHLPALKGLKDREDGHARADYDGLLDGALIVDVLAIERLVEQVLLTHAPNDVVELAAPDHDLRLL